MKVCHVWDADYPWDVRVEKVSRALTGAGHEVHLVARNRGGLPPTEQLPEARVHRLRPVASRRLNELSSFPAFFNPRWISRIREVCLESGADVVLVRDLPLAPAAIRVGRSLGLPVVMDMAENYPAMIRAIWETGRQGPLDWIVRNPRIVKMVEDWVLPRLDHTFVVVEESGERLVDLGVDPERVTVVCNTPPRDRLDAEPRAHTDEGPLRLFYLGLLEAPRGIGELIDAVAEARGAGVDVELEIVGDGREAGPFRAQARERGLLDSGITFHGFLPYPDGLEIMRSADVGVVPHYANESWNTTIPNKLFDYMAAGLAVLTSDVEPADRIVTETGAGLVYRDRDVHDAARAIQALGDAAVRRRHGRAGREAVASRYHWEADASRLNSALESVVRRGDEASMSRGSSGR